MKIFAFLGRLFRRNRKTEFDKAITKAYIDRSKVILDNIDAYREFLEGEMKKEFKK